MVGGRARSVTYTQDGTEHTVAASHVISTMPMRELVRTITPPPPPEVTAAAEDLHYRDYLTVALVVPESRSFPDNWIYIHATDVEVGRIQNYGSWSPYLVKDGRTCLGLEYFVFEGDAMWNMPDDDLITLATKELISLGLAAPGDVEHGYVVRVPKAYPYYDFAYKDNVNTIRKWIEAEAPNIHPVGRNGMHKYNNQDHSMYTAYADRREHLRSRPRRVDGQRRGGVPRGGVDRTRRPGAAAADVGGGPGPSLFASVGSDLDEYVDESEDIGRLIEHIPRLPIFASTLPLSRSLARALHHRRYGSLG